MDSIGKAKEILQVLIKYWVITGCLTFLFGFVGNTINLLVLTRIKYFRQNRSIYYLILESISDTFYQIFSFTLTIFLFIYGNDYSSNSLIWCKLKFFFAQTFGLITFSMICYQSLDQYFSTNPRRICELKFVYYLSLITIVICLLHSSTCLIFVNIIPSIGCLVSNEIWIRYMTYFFYPILVGLFPILISSMFSLLAYRNVRRIIRRQIPIERRRFDQQITAMIFLRVIFYICFTLPYLVHRIYVINVPIKQDDFLNYAIGQLIQAIAVSIVNLNYTVGEDFRWEIIEIEFCLGEFLYILFFIVTISSSSETDFSEEILAKIVELV